VGVHGAAWLSRPLVVVVLAFTLFGLLRPVVRSRLARRASGSEPSNRRLSLIIGDTWPDVIFAALMTILFGASLMVSSRWGLGAKLLPQVVGWAGLGFSFIVTVGRCFSFHARKAADRAVYMDIQTDYGDLTTQTILRRFAVYFLWCVFFLAAGLLIGLLPALLLFLVGFMRIQGKERWSMVAKVSVCTWLFCYALFHLVLHIPWPQSLIGAWFPLLRSTTYFNLI